MSTIRKATLTRTETGDDGTFGAFVSDSGFQCYSGELPWRDNASGRSCIPAGTYKCTWRQSPKHGFCYYVDNVKDRTDIEVHSSNWVGDADKGLKSQLLGCISLGRAIGDLAGQKALLSSRDAITGFETDMEKEPFELTITWGDGVKREA